tara:strand:+ start:3498 stop:4013 length:516 start_codon:yes stop_codon:yes gene_type:complete
MANVRLMKEIANKMNLPKSSITKLSSGTKIIQAKAAIDYIMSKIEQTDNLLHASMDKTTAEASTELAQIPTALKNKFVTAKGGGFFCSFKSTIPFIYKDGRVITFNRTNSAEEAPFAEAFADAMASYMGSTLQSAASASMKNNELKTISKRTVSTNLASVDTIIANIVSTY